MRQEAQEEGMYIFLYILSIKETTLNIDGKRPLDQINVKVILPFTKLVFVC